MPWPERFEDLKRGEGCSMCEQERGADTAFGPCVLSTDHADAILQRAGFGRGYTIVIHRGDRHVTEPTELRADEANAYWRDVLAVARAIETVFRPVKLNLMVLGNQLPHLHTHVVPRYAGDEDAGGPPAFDADAGPRSDEQMEADADALRAALRP